MALNSLVFIIGVGRSGTTLLQRMLHAHPEIKFSKETHFVKRYIRQEYKKGGLSKAEIDRITRKILGDELLQEYLSDEIDFNSISRNKNSNELLLALFFRRIFRDENITYIGDKDPLNTVLVPVLHRAFPEAKIIHIIRDPRAVISSRLKANWSRNKPIIWHAAEYSVSILKAIKEGKQLFGSNYYDLRYEELVEYPAEKLTELCDFLGLNFDSGMLKFHKESSSELIRSSELQWKSETLKPVENKNSQKWKESLTPDQLKTIEAALLNEMKTLKYELSYRAEPKLNLIKRMQFSLFKYLLNQKFSLS